MVQFALFAILAQSKPAPPADVDVWYCPYIEVVGHTPFDHTPRGTYDVRDAFGGTFGSVGGEQGRIVFEDDSGGPSQPDFIEWSTKEPVVINRLVVAWQDDAPGNNWRNLSHFWIYGRGIGDSKWNICGNRTLPLTSEDTRWRRGSRLHSTSSSGRSSSAAARPTRRRSARAFARSRPTAT